MSLWHETLVRSNNLNGFNLKWLLGQTATLWWRDYLFEFVKRLEGKVVPKLPHVWITVLLNNGWISVMIGVKAKLSKRVKKSPLNWGKRQTKCKQTETWWASFLWLYCWIEPCGPLTPDLPLGVCEAKGRSRHVATACVLLISCLSPPHLLQDALPPTIATSFFKSLGKFGNGPSSRPRRYSWRIIISLF